MNKNLFPKKVPVLSIIGWVYVITGLVGLIQSFVIWMEPGPEGVAALLIFPIMVIGILLGFIVLFFAKLDKGKVISKKTRIVVVSIALLIILINLPYILDFFR
ncbi:MAG: hypothetical protein AAB738_03540 [Patescibacteria group bacterium]